MRPPGADRGRVPPAKPARSASRPGARAGEPPAAGEANAARAARALWVTLAALALARLASAFVPSMWLWGINLQRFLSPLWAFCPWLVAALALFPPLARRAAPWCGRAGDALARSRSGPGVAAVLGAALVAIFPDRVRFVGDFLLQQGTVEQVGQPSVLFPQALPLDVLLHYRLPRVLSAARLFDANGAARLLGTIEAGALALLAVGFTRTLALRGSAALAAACAVFFTGALGMFTGFGKAFAEMVLLVAGVGVAGLRVTREGRGLLGLGALTAVAVTLHRSALAILPATALAYAWWWRGHARGGAWRKPAALAAHLIPLAACAVMLPIIAAIMRRWDAIHLAPEEVRAQGGAFRAAFAGARAADMLNLTVMLAPLALAAPLIAWGLGRVRGRGRELAFLVVLAAPFVLSIPFIHPAQGLFRDWDDFVAAGEALALIGAWLAGETLRGAPRFAWLGLAVALGVAAPAVQWLAHHADLDRGLERVAAFMLEAPPRTAAERGKTWDYLGIRNLRLERWDAAAAAFARAAETSPSPRILMEWATAETRRGHLREAQRIYGEIVARAPEDARAWTALTVISVKLRDREGARRAAQGLLHARPGDRYGLGILEALEADRGP